MNIPWESILIGGGVGCLVVGIVVVALGFWFILEINEALLNHRRRRE